MVGRIADEVVLSDEERRFLGARVRRHKAARSLSDRCRMILLCAEGLQSKEVAGRLGVHEHTVGKWRRRFVKDRIEGLTDEYRPGRPRTVSDEQVAQVIERTLQSTPKGATHWSIRGVASETGLSHTTIRRIWTAFGLQPHRSETFKLSTDPLFVDKVQDIVGLYLSPPNRAIILCVDEKSQIQALTARPRSLPRWISPQGQLSENVTSGIGQLSSWIFSSRSTGACPKVRMCISSWTTMQRTRRRRSRRGWRAARTGISTSHPLPPHGSTRWSAGSQN